MAIDPYVSSAQQVLFQVFRQRILEVSNTCGGFCRRVMRQVCQIQSISQVNFLTARSRGFFRPLFWSSICAYSISESLGPSSRSSRTWTSSNSGYRFRRDPQRLHRLDVRQQKLLRQRYRHQKSRLALTFLRTCQRSDNFSYLFGIDQLAFFVYLCTIGAR